MNSHAKKRVATAPGARFAVSPVAAGCAVLMMAMAPAYAQQAEPAPAPAAEPGKSATDLGTVTITGIRRGIEDAIAIKKDADRVVEAISAEDIGKLPDTSIAESIARMPGVAAQRTRGRAQGINVRGFGPDFATTLLNGREQATTGDSRGVEYDQYPSELFNAVELNKTTDAGLIGQGLSGTFDLQTVRPLNFDKRTIAVNYRRQKLGVGLDEEGDGDRFSISYVDQFADRTIGVALGWARLDETTGRTQRTDSWGVAEGPYQGQTVRAPGGFNTWLDQTEQTRDGAIAVLQWRPNKDFQSKLDFFYSKFDQDKSTKGFQAPVGFSSAGGYDPGAANLTGVTLNGNVVSAGTLDNFKGVVRNDADFLKDELRSFGWNNQLTMGEWTGVLDLAHSTAEREGGILETTAGLVGNGNAGGQTGTISWTGFDGNNVLGAQYTPTPNYSDRSTTKLTDVMGWGGGNATPQAGYSKLPNIKDEINAFRLSGKRNLPEGWFFSTAEFGLAYSDREKDRAYKEGRLIIAGSGGSANPYASAEVPGSAVSSVSGIPIVVWDPKGSVGPIYEVAPKLVADIANKDWTVYEELTTGYARFDIDSTLFGVPVRGNAGLQYQYADQSSRAYNVDNPTSCPGDVCATTETTRGTSYGDLLPSMNLVFDLGNGNIVRAAAARQLARPTINDMRGSLQFSVNTGTDPAKNGYYTGDGGNPYLEPFRANAFDLTYEKYFGTKAFFAAQGFYKSLSTYIYRQEVSFDYTPFITSETPPAPNGPVGFFTQPLNGSGGNVRGVELAGSLPLNLVSDWLDGFGIQASYARTDSSVSIPVAGVVVDGIPAGTNIPLPGLSKNVGNITAYFEKWGFSARIGSRYRSDFIGEVSSFTGDRQLTWVKSERVTDAQIGYEFQDGWAKGLSLLFQVNNLGDAEFIRYRDTPENEIERVKYGKTYLFGLNYRFQQ